MQEVNSGNSSLVHLGQRSITVLTVIYAYKLARDFLNQIQDIVVHLTRFTNAGLTQHPFSRGRLHRILGQGLFFNFDGSLHPRMHLAIIRKLTCGVEGIGIDSFAIEDEAAIKLA